MKTPHSAANLLHTAKRFVLRTSEKAVSGDEKLLQELAQAREEWQSAHSYFNNATDPELVDHAVLLLEAAERKYMYLLKEVKAKGLKVDMF